jgi:MFS family permease
VLPAAYRALLDISPARLPLVASIIGRLPIALSGLAAIFLVQAETGSFADAGVVEACYTIGAAVGLPAQGRLVDRLGQTRVVIPASCASAAAMAVFVIAARGGASVAVMGIVNVVAGLTFPPLSQCMRALWSDLLDDPDALQTAYALDAVVLEVAFISGPLLAAIVAASASPSAAVILGLALTLSGGLMFGLTAASRSWRAAGASVHWAGPLRSSGIWVLVGTSLGFGLANGALALALTAFGHQRGATEIVGPFISIQAAASMLGGIWYGAQRWSRPPEDRYPRLIFLFTLGFVPLVFAGSLPVMGIVMLISGLAIAPAAAVEYVLIDRLAPSGTSTEAFGWVITATVLGSGIGSAIGGAAVNGGHVRLGFLLALGGAVLACVASALGRPALRSQPEPSRA